MGRILIFGATGGTGKELVAQALQRGHDVTAFVRDPGKLAVSHAHLRVQQGDLQEPETVRAAIPNHQAVLSALGTRTLGKTTLLSDSLKVIIAYVNRTLRGWFEYFKHSHRSTFRPLDAWVRMRMRSILRKRQGKPGRGRGSDHHRWPNAFFTKQGFNPLGNLYAWECYLRQPRTG